MSPKEELALRAVYAQWTTERLARAATVEKGDYQPRAVELMLAEMNNRGVAESQAAVLAAAVPPPKIETSGRKATFLYPVTLNRKQYALRLLSFVAVLLFGSLLLSLLPWFQQEAFAVFLVAGLAYRIAALDIPRIRNTGSSPWLLLLLLVPIANIGIIVLLFAMPPKR